MNVNLNVLSRRAFAGVALAAFAVTASGCGGSDDTTDNNPTGTGTGTAAAAGIKDLSGKLTGSGASFPNNFYQAALDALAEENDKLEVTYESKGSGTGKKEFGSGLTDFAGSDSTVKDGDGPKAGEFLYVPTVAAPITVSYNLSGVDKLQLSPENLGAIFSRSIKTWNDPKIAADNPGVTLPAKPIVVAHRSDGSGTTNNFTKYLVAAAPTTWKLGSGDTVAWPADTQGGDKNTGVAQIIKSSDGAIGYVDFADATASDLKFAAIKNKDGKFVAASLEGATAALAGATLKDDLTYNPLNAAGADSYPITAPTYILVKTKYSDATKAQNVKGFLTWLISDQKALDTAKENGYAVLPDTIKTKALAQIEKIA